MGQVQKDTEQFQPDSQKDWRKWLQQHHDKKQAVWLLCYKMKTGVPTIRWSDAVDEALCFGWIDSTRRSVDEDSFIQLFTRRKPNSMWSKINKEKVARLMAEGLMAPAGLNSIALAQQNGSWNLLDEAEEMLIPKDLEAAFRRHKGAKVYFLGLSHTLQKRLLVWLVLAKRDETRQKRITEIAELAGQQQLPKAFQ
ncbi:MAG TPA: YdeI/OmpD-associated family protein [Chitinophagaceae bacterium]|nr:YdeI/OmpD-associated family protein [Chitinophagaceae bacterium]